MIRHGKDNLVLNIWSYFGDCPRWSFERCTFTEVEQPISIYGDAERPLRTGAVKPNLDGDLSPLAAGPFGYAMAQYDPLFARTFFTDFVRSATKTPAAVSGVRQALKRLLR